MESNFKIEESYSVYEIIRRGQVGEFVDAYAWVQAAVGFDNKEEAKEWIEYTGGRHKNYIIQKVYRKS